MTQSSSKIFCCVQMEVVPKVLLLPSAAVGCHRAEAGMLPKNNGEKTKKNNKQNHLIFSSCLFFEQNSAGYSRSKGKLQVSQSNTIDGPVHAAEADGSEPYSNKPHNNNPYNWHLGLDAPLLLTTAMWCSLGPALAGITGRFILLGQLSCC